VSAANAFNEIEPARMYLGLRLGAHPVQDLLRIGQEGENGGGRCCDLGLASNHERFKCLLVAHVTRAATSTRFAAATILSSYAKDTG
jgi:hypothetical protein